MHKSLPRKALAIVSVAAVGIGLALIPAVSASATNPQSLVITPADNSTITQATVGSSYSVSLSAKYNNTSEPSTVFSLHSDSDTLPGGLSVSQGKIVGTPVFHNDGTDGYNWVNGVATFHPTVEASYTSGSGQSASTHTADADYTLTLTLPDAPSISDQSTYVQTDHSFTYQVEATAPTYGSVSYSILSPCPDSWSINSTTGVLSGSVDSTPRTLTCKVKINDSDSDQSDSATVTFTTEAVPALTDGTPNSGIVGDEYNSWTVPATGTSLQLSATGLPAGLSLVDGQIVGTPTDGDEVGPYTVTVTATNDVGPSTDHDYTLYLYATPVITTDSLPFGTVGDDYTSDVEATGYGVTFAVVGDGSLPTGLTLNSDGSFSGAPDSEGSWTFTVEATNEAGYVDKTYTITTYAVPVITTDSLPFGTVGDDYTPVVEATGDDATFAIVGDGSLPSGLTLNANGSFSGAPDSEGSWTFTVEATNDAGYVDKTFTITTYAVPVITTSTLPDGVVGNDYSEDITASGTGDTFAAENSNLLPTGLTLNSNGTLSGTPTAEGTFTFEVIATNLAGDSVPQTLTVTITDPAQQLSTLTTTTGGDVTVVGSGFLPDETVQIWLHSNPILLTTVVANEDGSFSVEVTIPSGTAVGAHRIESRGSISGSVFTDLTVSAVTPTASDTSLAFTGTDVGAWPWIALAALLVGGAMFWITRRRKPNES